MESKLHDLEDLLVEIWPDLADDFVDLNAESTRKAVALFVAVLYLRHPSNLEAATHLHRQLVSIFEKAKFDAEGRPFVNEVEIGGDSVPFDPSGWHEYKDWDKTEHHRFFVNIVQSEAVVLAKMFLKKRWSVILSDKPETGIYYV